MRHLLRRALSSCALRIGGSLGPGVTTRGKVSSFCVNLVVAFAATREGPNASSNLLSVASGAASAPADIGKDAGTVSESKSLSLPARMGSREEMIVCAGIYIHLVR